MNSRCLIVFILLSCTTLLQAQRWTKMKEELLVSNPPFAQCHASTIVALSSGSILSAWFAGSGEGKKDVCIWASVNHNGTWSSPEVIATGIINDSLRYPCWNPVLFTSSNNSLYLFYKVGPSPQHWWGMVMTSADDGKTWSVPVCLPEGLLGPIKNKPVQLPDGTILSPSSTETANKWNVHIERSVDQGHTWQKIQIDTTGFDVIQPAILEYGRGRLQLLCRSKQGVVVQSWSKDNGKTWSRLSGTSLPNPNSGIDAVTLKSGEQMIVYNPDLPGKEWYNGRARLKVAVSPNGITWKDIMTLEEGTREEYSYPAIIQAENGEVHITYTYDRKNIKYVRLKKPGRK